MLAKCRLDRLTRLPREPDGDNLFEGDLEARDPSSSSGLEQLDVEEHVLDACLVDEDRMSCQGRPSMSLPCWTSKRSACW